MWAEFDDVDDEVSIEFTIEITGRNAMARALERILLWYVYLMHFALYSRVCNSQDWLEKLLESRHPSRPLTEPGVTAESPESPHNHQVPLQPTRLNVSRRRFTVSERKSGELAIISMYVAGKKQNVKVQLRWGNANKLSDGFFGNSVHYWNGMTAVTQRILNFGFRLLSNRSGDEHAGGGTCADGVFRGSEDALCEPRDGGPRHQDVQHVKFRSHWALSDSVSGHCCTHSWTKLSTNFYVANAIAKSSVWTVPKPPYRRFIAKLYAEFINH